MIASGVAVLTWLAVVIGICVGHNAVYSPTAALYSEMFPAHVRYSGASLGYQIGAVLSGGFAPLIAAALLVAGGGSPWLIVGYFAVLTAITFTAAYFARETHRDEIGDER
jgi:MFS family permease